MAQQSDRKFVICGLNSDIFKAPYNPDISIVCPITAPMYKGKKTRT